MKVLVTGATGFVGRRLCEVLNQRGHSVAVLSRNGFSAKQSLPVIDQAFSWQPSTEPAPAEAFDGVDGVVHLLGESVQGRWNAANKAAIRDSRVIGTRNLVAGIARLESRPKVLVSASAIGYYGDRADEELIEESAPGDDFLAGVSREWENEAVAAERLGVRVTLPRISVVLAPGGGALGAMLLPFKLGAGGPLGSGRQWWSWIHRDDLVAMMIQLLESDFSGPINAAAPNPVRQKEFAQVLGKVLRRPAFMPAPAFALKIALGGFSTELLSSKRVLPKAAERLGFSFRYPRLEEALRKALGR
jgi:uncharacterized protein (TIGR01777 family)